MTFDLWLALIFTKSRTCSCTLQDRYKFIFVVCRLTKFTDLKGWGCKVPQEVLKKLLVGLQVRPWYNQFLQAGEVDGIMKWTHKSEMVVNGDGMFLHIMTNSHWLFQYFKKNSLSTCRCLLRQNLRRTQPSDSALAWMRRLDLPKTHFHPKVRPKKAIDRPRSQSFDQANQPFDIKS